VARYLKLPFIGPRDRFHSAGSAVHTKDLRGAEAPLFHAVLADILQFKAQSDIREQSQRQGQRQQTGVSAPHEQCRFLRFRGNDWVVSWTEGRAALDGQPGAAVLHSSSTLFSDFHKFISSDVHMTLLLILKWEYWK
jgi:hypothetical protein